MGFPLSVIVAAFLLAGLTGAADATEARRKRAPSIAPCGTERAGAVCATSKRREARRESHETVRANAVDPARTHGDFPDWARAAFGPNADSFPD